MKKIQIFLDAQVMQFHFTGIAKITEKIYDQPFLHDKVDVQAVYQGNILGKISKKIKLKRFSPLIPRKLWRKVIFPLYLNIKKPSIVHFPWNGSPPFLLKKSHRVVSTLCDVLPLEIPGFFRDAYSREAYIRSVQKTIDRSSVLFTISKYSKRQILAHFSVNIPIVILPIGPTLPVIKKSENKFKWQDYLYVGGYDSRKGLLNLINVFLDLKENNLISGKLILVGKINYFSEEFRDKVLKGANKGYVVERGYVNDEELSFLYSNAKALIYPSKYEGFGLPPLEAMSHGCPILTTPFSSIPEVCGDSALYFDSDEYIDFKNTILNFDSNEDLRSEMISKGYLQLNKFSWDLAATIFINAIK